MKCGPVIDRELRRAARRPWTFRVRVGFSLAAIAAYILILLTSSSPRYLGQVLLTTLTILGMTFCLLAGAFVTADCVSSERREGTLGLLFLTPLRGIDVALGKLASSGLQTIVGILALLPLFFLPILHGGVTWDETVRILLVMLLSLALSLTLGLLASVLSDDPRVTIFGTVGAILALALVPFALGIAQMVTAGGGLGSFSWVPMLSPIWIATFAFDAPYQSPGGTRLFWRSATLLSALIAGLGIVASWRLARVWRLDPGPSPSSQPSGVRSWFGFLRSRRAPPSPQPAPRLLALALSRLPPGVHPYFARLRRPIPVPLGPRIFHGILLLFIAAMTLVIATPGVIERPLYFVLAIGAAFILHTTSKIQVTLDTLRDLHSDRVSGALELVLVAPGIDQHFLHAIDLAGRDAGRSRARLMLGINTALIVITFVFSSPLRIRGDDFLVFITIFISGVAASLTDLRALRWLCLWHALHAATLIQAALRTLATVLLPPWIGFIAAMMLMASTNAMDEDVMVVFFLIYAVGCAFYNTVVSEALRNRLAVPLRLLLTGGISRSTHNAAPG